MSSKKGGLGRNLDSLIPTPINRAGSNETVGERSEIPLTWIKPNPRQPRTVFDNSSLEELAASIKEIGILQPPVVRKISDNQYELIMGERRYRAAKLAGLVNIPVIIRQTSDNELLREALVENIHRSNLNSLEEAAAYNQMLSDFGFTHDELAERLGKSRPVISNTLRLLNLPPSVQKRLAAGTISAGHARALLGLSSQDEMERLANKIVSEGLSVRSIEELIALSSPRQNKSKKSKSKTSDGKYAELVERLEGALDTRVTIAGSNTGGKIVIEYADGQDLQRIVGVIS
ncbi:MAG: ParB/RepB/Spo0J family partition protein [Actinobacteria bacterium]|nr:ParB/RepB/Spo0J family partition protein [Actinomycetota bacterium]NBQ66847.1 ParB/RepB/Spo0J family partition protein [Actinomycetota bacterium]NBY50285.1 ParB/RepB/Spo0J family partition protein [Actinomycetota bacterium]NCV17094.1 ParB/RepB/Spo0J family partition protein [Actinomycetota bacterium]NDB37391.1 ParB/RepB/Spo0J family partition protein [Actinomycetota bacterium]